MVISVQRSKYSELSWNNMYIHVVDKIVVGQERCGDEEVEEKKKKEKKNEKK